MKLVSFCLLFGLLYALILGTSSSPAVFPSDEKADASLPSRNDVENLLTSYQSQAGLIHSHGRSKRQAGEVLAVLGVVSGIITIYDHIANKWTPADEDMYLKQFQEASYELDQINKKLDQMMAEIKVEFIKTNLAPDIKIIGDCDFSLRDYLDCLTKTTDDSLCDSKKNIFMMNAEGSTGNQLANSIRHIMQSMAGAVPGNDIPATYRVALDNYEYKLVEQLDLWMGWVNMGMYVHAAYVETKEMSEMENSFFHDFLDTSYNVDMPKKREDECLLCRDESSVPQEIQDVLHDCQSLSNSDALEQVYAKLSDKYRTKHWFVTVYNDISGFNNHCYDGDFPSSLHMWGKNAWAYSVAGIPRISADDWTYLDQHYNNQYGNNAETAWNDLTSGTGYRVRIGVVKRYNGLFAMWGRPLDVFFNNGGTFTVIGLPDSGTAHFANYKDEIDSDFSIFGTNNEVVYRKGDDNDADYIPVEAAISSE